jgi:hypothetical protein
MAGRILWFGLFLLVPATLIPPTSLPDPGKRDPWPRYHCPLARPCPLTAEMAGGNASVADFLRSGPPGSAIDPDFTPCGIDLAFVPLPDAKTPVRPEELEDAHKQPDLFTPRPSPHLVVFPLEELLCNFPDPGVAAPVSACEKKR